MTRLVTLIAVALAAGVSVGLYQLAYEVQRLEDELADLNRALQQERENIEVLHAEWSYLSRPDALQERALRNLTVVPMSARQILAVGDLPRRDERMRLDDAGAAAAEEAWPPRPRFRPALVAPSKIEDLITRLVAEEADE